MSYKPMELDDGDAEVKDSFEGGADDQAYDPDARDSASCAVGCCCVCCCIGIIIAIGMCVKMHNTSWECDPDAPRSTYGDEYFPAKVLLDEVPQGWFGSMYGPQVDVYNDDGNPQVRLGSFQQVWCWFGSYYGYIEETGSHGEFLRFTAYKPWHFFWQYPPWTIEVCPPGATPSYELQRDSLWHGQTHEVYKMSGGSTKTLVAIARHVKDDLNFRASMLSGMDLNTQWRLGFVAPSPKEDVVLAEAAQFYNENNMILNMGASNWKVQRKTVENATTLEGAEPLPGDVVVFTSALYDLTVGSDRRRRTSRRLKQVSEPLGAAIGLSNSQ